MDEAPDVEQMSVNDDFAYVLGFLPPGWRDKARELGALRRCRNVPDAETLLRVLLIHLAEGCSLRETSLRAHEGGLAELSDVAIMDRLRTAGEWFRWMSQGLMARWMPSRPGPSCAGAWNVRLVDATRIKEPGPTGSSWCMHYAIALPGLACQEVIVRDKETGGESFARFKAKPGDLLVGDRAYGLRPGIAHVVAQGADVLARLAMDHLPLASPQGKRIDLLARLRRLKAGEAGDWPVMVQPRAAEPAVLGRVCAIRKSRQAAERARARAVRQAQKQGSLVKEETLEGAGYIFVFTTATSERMTAWQALELYRARWQIEIVFKRLKSILGLGHLRKSDMRSARAWLEGKLFVAFLVEALINQGAAFFPWGYPAGPRPRPMAMPLA